VGSFNFAHQLVRFVLRHLTTTDHILEQVAGALEYQPGEAGSGTDHVFHRSGHFAAGFETYLVRLCSHLGDGIFYVRAAVSGAALRWNRWCGDPGCGGCSRDRGYGLD
jgi:hypothetical protein